MRFSTRIRYGLRLLLRLAKEPPDQLVQLARVAHEEHISCGYLEQIVHALKPLNLFRVARGVHGGYALAQPPYAINLLDVFLHLEGQFSLVACLEPGNICDRDLICSTKYFWQDFDQHIRQYLGARTLQSLINSNFWRDEHMWDYTQAVHDHFLHPHNAGPMPDANAVGEVGSLACGDALRLYLKIGADGKIEKASFQTFGCASAIASSSVLTDMITGMNVDEALKVTNKDIVANLGGLPREKMHCSVMGQEALEAAIRNWRGDPAMPHAQEIGKLVCKCFGVTDAQIIRTIKENNLTTLEEVTDYTKAGGACGQCLDEIGEILAAELAKRGQACCPVNKEQAAPKPKLTNLERMQKVMAELANLKLADGSAQLVDVEGLKISVKLTGADTKKLRAEVEKILRDKVEDNLVVVEA